jgi:hypothetical protein
MIMEKFIQSFKFKYIVDFIYNGNIITSLKVNNMTDLTHDVINRQIKLKDLHVYGFMIYSKLSNNGVYNKKIIHSTFSVEDDKFELTNNKFIQVKYGHIIIQFKTNTYNYYIKKNVFDKNFMKYFLKNHYHIDTDDIAVEILDNTMKKYIVDFNKEETITI